MVTVKFHTVSEAFDEDRAEEIGNVLRDVARDVEDGKTKGSILDRNGVAIGSFECK